MKVFEIQDGFGFDNLKRAERKTPTPGPGQVVIEVRAASINYRDVLMIGGLYNPRQKLPLIPLSDGAGEVVSVGPGVQRVAVGDRVVASFFQAWLAGPIPRDVTILKQALGGPLDGSLATHMLLTEQSVVRIPPDLSFIEAACLPCAGLTAFSAVVDQAQLSPGDTVVLQGTGGVSIFGLQFAKMIGCRTIVTSSSDAKLAKAKAIGADETINYMTAPEWSKEVRRMTAGLGASLVLEVGGAGTLDQSMRSVHPGGQIAIIGVLSGNQGEVSVLPILMQNLRLQGIVVGSRDRLEAMVRAMIQHRMRPIVDRVFPFERAKEAINYASQGKHFGKVCIEI